MNLYNFNNSWRNQNNILIIKSLGFQICLLSDSLFLLLASLYMSHWVSMCLTDNVCFFFFYCFRFVRIFKFCIFLSKTFSLKVLLSKLFIENSSKLSRLFSNIVFKEMISCPSMYIIFTLFVPNGYLVPMTVLHHLLKYKVYLQILIIWRTINCILVNQSKLYR